METARGGDGVLSVRISHRRRFFHVGGGAWVVGRTAVFCFYLISGFLICRVLDQAYWGSANAIGAFYCNRALRLLPLFVVISVATVLLFTAHGSNVFPRSPSETATLLRASVVGAPLLDSALPALHYSSQYKIPFITGNSDSIPQGWSIGVEIVFYMFAPLLVLLGRRGVWPLATLAVLATALFVVACLTAPDPRFIDSAIYKNAVTSAFMFVWGGAIYVILRDTKFRVPFAVAAPTVILFACYIYFWAATKTLGTHDMTATAFVLNILLAIPVSALVCLTVVPERLRRWETRLGDLTYGIYLNHFLVAAGLLWMAEAYGGPIFGRYNDPAFGVIAALGCAILAFATLHFVERPVEQLRRLIKRHSALAQPALPIQASPAA